MMSEHMTQPTIAALQSLPNGTLTDRDVVSVATYASENDGGGGLFFFQGTPPNSAIVSNVVSTSVFVTDVSNTTPVVLTTQTAHGLSTDHSVLVAGVVGEVAGVVRNTAANGPWLVKVLTSTTFELRGSAGNAPYISGGTVSRAVITTGAAHGLSSGDLVMVAGVLGTTGANGRWFPVGFVDSTTFTVPAPSTGAYVSGGQIGDGGTSIPRNTTGRWLRIVSERNDVAWFGAVGDGRADDTAAIAGAINAAIKANRQVVFAGKLYNVNREIDLHTEPVALYGEGYSYGNPPFYGTRILATNPGMRSVFNLRAQFVKVRGFKLDCDRKARYGIYVQGGAESSFDECEIRNAKLDNIHIAKLRDDASLAINDFLRFRHCFLIDCGKLYCTAALAAVYGGLSTVTGTVSYAANAGTVTGCGTSFTALGIRSGDFIRIGAAGSESVLEIDTVDSDIQLTLSVYSRGQTTIRRTPIGPLVWVTAITRNMERAITTACTGWAELSEAPAVRALSAAADTDQSSRCPISTV